MRIVSEAKEKAVWDQFLLSQTSRPFLQSWTMGEVYKRIGQEPVRLIIKEGETVRGVCFAHIVPARRGKHLSIPYGPVLENCATWKNMEEGLRELLKELKRIAKESGCSFIRMSPFWTKSDALDANFKAMGIQDSPLHLLAEHLWYLPLVEPDPWSVFAIRNPQSAISSEDALFKEMRSTTRNLIRRAEKEGVTVTASVDPVADLPHFLKLHDETRKRHGFTPYTDSFFRAQVEEFAKTKNVILYLARHQGEVIASSIHMTFGGETSYHHGASVISKIPASYLLQWTAIRDALRRGDHLYNFWGIAPEGNPKHPFAGVTLFKTGFGGKLLELTHCRDIPLSSKYYLTRGFEAVRKWRRGF
ncbi:MAG: peptidoglycan bridge formation glycyltransferase FemA/FemB family protein [Candidatus Peribacteraceae bacterium]|nr:peptidoglycan bridge formation glycyltransferase FemA/FemB family protein [Candidatus Peribacteraceae bacterium]